MFLLPYEQNNCVYLAGGLDKGIPFDSGKETTKKVGVKVRFAESEFNVGELEWEIVGSAALGVACEEIVGDQTDHRGWRGRRGQSGPITDRAAYRFVDVTAL
jgi:hypothetical protein